jgi:DNA repair photolyase
MDHPLTYAQTYQVLFGRQPPHTITWETSTAGILNPGRGFMGAFDYTLQVQVGCPGGCLFCYVPTGARLTPREIRGNDGGTWGFRVRNKADVIAKLQKHLQQGDLADKTIYWSGITDPYAAPPAITRTLWTTLLQAPSDYRPRRLVVQTRFRPDRDVDLMADYQETTTPIDSGPALLISYSIGTDDNHWIAAWEKATPRFEQRLQAIHTLRQAGLFVVATLSPLGFWQDLSGTLTQLQAWGVAYLTTLFLKQGTPSAKTPTRFLAYLQAQHPQLLDPAWQAEQLHIMQAIYGEQLVLVGQAGFSSLVHPHLVVASEQRT